MRMLAAGFTKDGDKLKAATDTTWWGKPYAYPMWNPVGTYLDKCKAAQLEGPFVWDEGIANAEPGTLSQAIIAIADEIAMLRSRGLIGCTDYYIPARRGIMPIPNVACQATRKAKEIADPVIEPIRRAKSDINSLAFILLLIAIASRKEK